MHCLLRLKVLLVTLALLATKNIWQDKEATYTVYIQKTYTHSTQYVPFEPFSTTLLQLFSAVPVRMANNSILGPRVFEFRSVFHHCECYITVVAAYSKCKMSVTDGGVFAALQSSRHAHISVFLSVSVSLPL